MGFVRPSGYGNAGYTSHQPVVIGRGPQTQFQEMALWSKQDYAAHVSEASSRRRQTWGWLEGNWAWELMSITIGIGAMVGIIVVLSIFDGKPLDEWNGRVMVGESSLDVSPNVVISVLGTVSKSSLALVIASCISQTKWNWFHYKSRPLEDMQIFDDSSRGPLGSLKLLWRTRAAKFASLGAAATILALAFDTFLQLIIIYSGESRPSTNHRYSIRRATRFDAGTLDFVAQTESSENTPDGNKYYRTYSAPSPDMLASVYNGFLISNGSRIDPDTDCPGNCTFDPFPSIAVCHICNDITDTLRRSNVGLVEYEYDLQTDVFSAESLEYATNTLYPLRLINPYGFAVNHTTGQRSRGFNARDYYPLYAQEMSLKPGSDPRETVYFQDYQTLLYYIQTVRVEPGFIANEVAWETARVTAMECGLVMCINEYESRIVNGRLEETIRESWSEKETRSWEVFPERQYQPNPAAAIIANSSSGLLGNISWNPLYNGHFMNRTDFQLVAPSDRSAVFNLSESFNLSQPAVDSTIELLLTIFNSSKPIPGYRALGVKSSGSVNGSIPAEANNMKAVLHTANSTFYFSDFVRAVYENDNLTATFENLAHDMSSAVRNSGAAAAAADATAAAAVVAHGLRNDWVTVIRVRWAFTSLPLAVCLLAALMLAGAAWQTRSAGTEIWKEGALAALVYGVEDRAREDLRAEASASGMGDAARRKVRLVRDGDGWVLSDRQLFADER